MARIRPCRLVIDASISHAAGDRAAERSRLCTKALNAVIEVKHRLAMSPTLLEEWKRHQTGFARGWLRSMFAQRLVEALDVVDDQALRARIERVAPQTDVATIMRKDMHLIEAALASDSRIMSLDDRARHHFRHAARAVSVLRKLCWVNPCNAAEEAVEWLRAGAPAETHRKLGHTPPED
jgi:hypothetical protein